MCWCDCDYWQEGSLTFQRKVTGFADKHLTSPHRAVASGFSASPSSPNSKYSTHAFPGTTCPGFHSFWLHPFPKLRSSHSRWAVHCCPRLREEDSSSDDSANSGSDSDVTLHFTILEGRASPAGIATLFFDPFSCFFFVDFFTSAWFLFLNLLCFWPLVFPHMYFCFVATFFFLIVFLRTSWISFCWAFSFSCLFPVFLLCISLLSLLEIVSLFFPKDLLVSCLFCLCHFLLFRSLHKISRFFCSVFLFSFFYSAYFILSSFFRKKSRT